MIACHCYHHYHRNFIMTWYTCPIMIELSMQQRIDQTLTTKWVVLPNKYELLWRKTFTVKQLGSQQSSWLSETTQWWLFGCELKSSSRMVIWFSYRFIMFGHDYFQKKNHKKSTKVTAQSDLPQDIGQLPSDLSQTTGEHPHHLEANQPLLGCLRRKCRRNSLFLQRIYIPCSNPSFGHVDSMFVDIMRKRFTGVRKQ